MKCISSALLGLVAFAGVALAADPFRHNASGFECLRDIAGWTFTRVHEYEPAYPGQGVSCTYVAPDAPYGAQVYVFNDRVANVPADIGHPLVSQLRDRTLRDIERSAQSHGETARAVDHSIVNIDTPRGRVLAYYDALIITTPTGTRTTWSWLWTARNHFIKVRMTRAGPGTLHPRRAREFFEAVVRLTVE